MLRRPFATFTIAVLAAGALALGVTTADARPRGGRGGGGRVGVARGGFRGGVRVGRGWSGGRGWGWGWRGAGVRVYGYPYYRSGYGYGGYVPYYGYGGYVPYSTYSPSYNTYNYVPSGTTVSGYSSPDTSVEETPAVATDSQQAEADSTAHLMFVVPENATIWVEDQKTTQTGTEREFVSPPLAPVKKYTYSVRIRYQTDNGKVVEETRKVYVRAGDRWRVDFTKPAPANVTQ